MPRAQAISARDVIRGRFWLNLVVILVATSWIPLVSMEIAGPDGEVTTHYVPLYRCYQALFAGPSLIAVVAVIIHLALCFAISFMVRRWILQAQQKA